jgi:hypothetical protein
MDVVTTEHEIIPAEGRVWRGAGAADLRVYRTAVGRSDRLFYYSTS